MINKMDPASFNNFPTNKPVKLIYTFFYIFDNSLEVIYPSSVSVMFMLLWEERADAFQLYHPINLIIFNGSSSLFRVLASYSVP
jgi:hypothetical protein